MPKQVVIEIDEYRPIVQAMLSVPGMSKKHSPDLVMEEMDGGAKHFVKFMSDHGKVDDINGQAFRAFLIRHNVDHCFFEGRKFTLGTPDIKRLFLR